MSSSTKSQDNQQHIQEHPTMSKTEINAKVDEIVKSRLETTQPLLLESPLPVIDFSQMVVGKEIGAGSYSCAYDLKRIGGKQKEASKAFILKKLSKKVVANPLMFAACATDLVQEGKILAFLNHPNVVKIKAWSGEDMVDTYLKGSRDRCYLLIERLDQNLEHQMAKWKEAKPTIWNLPATRRDIEKEIELSKMDKLIHLAKALQHLHRNNVLHRDLKPQNIGFDSSGNLKVFDFDLARVLPASEGEDTVFHMTRNVGSPRYMATEVKNGQPYNLKADVYSFGLLTYQIFTGKIPWKGLDYNWSQQNKAIPKNWPSELRLELENCQSPYPNQRPNMNLLEKMLGQDLSSKDDNDIVDEGDIMDLGLCGVTLPECSYRDFEDLFGLEISNDPNDPNV
jgi:serine/threonine protein kinase